MLKTMWTSYFAAGKIPYARIRVVATWQEPWWNPCNELLDIKANHIEAARAYAREQNWSGKWAYSSLTDKGYIFVPVIDNWIKIGP